MMQTLFTDRFTKGLTLLMFRISLAGLMFWWGLTKVLGTGTGQGVSDKYYGGVFTIDILLAFFGGVQVLAAFLLALGIFRWVTLPFQLIMNGFVAIIVWQSLIDPFWLWTPGEKPETVNALFYPSLIVAIGSFLLIAFRDQDSWALDRVIKR